MLKIFKSYVSTNLITATWSIFLAIGGLIFFSYYWMINYLPIFDIQSYLALLITFSLGGLITALTLTIIQILPSFIWNEFVLKNEYINKNLILIPYQNTPINLRSFTCYFLIPQIIFITGFTAILFNENILFFLLNILSLFYCINLIEKNYNNKKTISNILRGIVLFFLTLTFSLIIILPIFFIFTIIFKTNGLNEGFKLFFSFAFSIILIFINYISIQSINTPQVKYKHLVPAALSLFFLFYLFLISDSFKNIPLSLMKTYQLGNITPKQIILEKNSCKLIKLNGIIPVENNDYCIVENVEILSRVGAETLLKHKNKRFTIESNAIVSISDNIK
jgi:hypothetical protein